MRARFPACAVALAAALPLAGCGSAPGRLADTGAELTQECEQLTGSRIRVKDRRNCDSPHAMRTFSAEELRHTGEMDLAEALRQLDPRFQ